MPLDKLSIDTTCTVVKFSRFEPCCTRDAQISKMTIIPGDEFESGEYTECIPDGYYTHFFVLADGCGNIHLSPLHFDHPPCVRHDIKIGDNFQCNASCQSKTYTMEDVINYDSDNMSLTRFFVYCISLVLVIIVGVYLLLHCRSHRNKLYTLETPFQQDISWKYCSSSTETYVNLEEMDHIDGVLSEMLVRSQVNRMYNTNVGSELSVGGDAFSRSDDSIHGSIGGESIYSSSVLSHSVPDKLKKKDPTIDNAETRTKKRRVTWAEKNQYFEFTTFPTARSYNDWTEKNYCFTWPPHFYLMQRGVFV